MTLTIVSGAAPGVEQGAIEAAVNLALRWQGWASEQSILTVAPVYRTGLQPTSATDPGMVRRLNIQGADGALVFSTSMVTAGVAAFCDRWTERMGRAFLHVTLNPALFGGAVWTAVDGSKTDRRVVGDEVIERVRAWLRDLPSGRVYITGPSADDVPGIQGAVRDALFVILQPFAVDEVRQTTRMMGLVEQAAVLAPSKRTHWIHDPDFDIAACGSEVGTRTTYLERVDCPDCRSFESLYRPKPYAPGEKMTDRHPNSVIAQVVEETIAKYDGQTDCRGEPLDLGPATRADLAELDAVPEPVDSDAPGKVYAQRTQAYRSADPPEGLDEVQRADLDATIRQAEREIRDPVEERARAYHNLVATAPGPIGGGYHDDEDDEPPTPGDQTA